jgi:hypothetical protein
MSDADETDARPRQSEPIRKTPIWKLCRSICYITCILLFDFRAYG